MSVKIKPVGTIQKRGAFTLIELLVVIAIIAILAAMLLPALAKAKSRAYAVNDISNCKQTMLATAMYCGDNNDILPHPGWVGGGAPWVDNWVTGAKFGSSGLLGITHTLGNYQTEYDKQVSYFCGQAYGTAGAAPAGAPYTPGGQLFQYLKSPKILLCPQDNKMDKDQLARAQIITSYAFNGAVIAYTDGQAPYKLTRFKPTNILQWENAEKSNWTDFSNEPKDWFGTWPAVVQTYSFSDRHGKAAQVGRMDGSAAREVYANMKAWADSPTGGTKNDLYCCPIHTDGH